MTRYGNSNDPPIDDQNVFRQPAVLDDLSAPAVGAAIDSLSNIPVANPMGVRDLDEFPTGSPKSQTSLASGSTYDQTRPWEVVNEGPRVFHWPLIFLSALVFFLLGVFGALWLMGGGKGDTSGTSGRDNPAAVTRSP